jgi:hypothetical protein
VRSLGRGRCSSNAQASPLVSATVNSRLRAPNKKPPPSLAGVSVTDRTADQPADEDDAGAIGVASDEDAGAIGAAEEEAGAIGVASEDDAAADDDAGAIGVASDDEAAADEDAGAIGAASDDDAGAADELTAAELDAVLTVVVLPPRLKIQMRPMITITATIMIIQVLRFMGLTLRLRKVTGKNDDRSCLTLGRFPAQQPVLSSVIGGAKLRRLFAIVVNGHAA